MAEGHSRGVVITALAANGTIAVAKTVAAVFTHSGALTAEAVHSFADCLNQVLLLIGLAHASRGPSEKYPLGTGRASYFWSFLVALLLFFGGGVFSIGEGVEKVLHPVPVANVWAGLLVLGFSLAMELGSLAQCIRTVNQKRGSFGLVQYLRVTKDAELVVVAAEDLAAVTGLCLAGVSLALGRWVHPVFDALGSVLVGLVLVFVAAFLARKVKSLLLGERANPEIEAAVRAAASEDRRIVEVLRLLTVQQGPGEVMLAAKLRLADTLAASDVVVVINEFEARVRLRAPDVRWQFIEPDVVA